MGRDSEGGKVATAALGGIAMVAICCGAHLLVLGALSGVVLGGIFGIGVGALAGVLGVAAAMFVVRRRRSLRGVDRADEELCR